MSCNYAEGLSPYHDKGQLGLEEKFDVKSVVSAKVSLLTKWVNEAKHVVIHTGAGISTSAGIPDFRGPQGVWTLEAKGEKPDTSKDFNEAVPTITHMAIMKLVDKKKVKFVVSQNIDGLHLRSNLPRKYLSELHGNMFTEQCSSCNRQFVRSTPVPSVGQKSLNKPCPTLKANGRPCRGRLHDTILDWEHNLPENDLGMADYHSCLADLSICLGTTMQIVPSGNLPLYTKKHGGKLVIINLQPTKHDKKADLLIHAYVDEVMTMLMKNLNIKIPKYLPKNDPSRTLSSLPEKYLEWTISDKDLQKMKKIYEEKCGSKEAKKRLEMIDDDIPLNVTKTFKRKAKEEDDSDLEVLDVIVKSKKTREKRRASKKNSPPVYNNTITIKKVSPPQKKAKHEAAEKITIKKNVTPTKTKYEIVTKPKKVPKCEIVYCTDQNNDQCTDLDMICESDDDEMTNNFTYNFKRYLYEDVKKEEIKDESSREDDKKLEMKEEIKSEIKLEEEEAKKETKIKEETQEEKKEDSVVLDKKSKEVIEIPKVPEVTETKTQENTANETTELSETENNEAVSTSVEDTQASGEKQLNEESKLPEESEKTDKKEEHSKENESSNIEEVMEVNPQQPNTDESEKTMHEKELAELISTSEPEKPSEPENVSEDKEKDKSENLYQNIESELSSLSNSNLESIDQMVNQAHDNSMAMTNSSINENYEFYSGDYNSANNQTDLDYYNNF